MNNSYKIKLKKGDSVVVISGKDKGKTGIVLATHKQTNKVTVEGINVVKKHLKPSKQHPQGGISDKTMPIYVSKVAIVEPTSKKPSKICVKQNSEGKNLRVYKRTGKEIK